MKHAILGAGAIGGLMGAALAHFGEQVTVIVRPDKLQSYPQDLTLERSAGTLTAPVHAVNKLDEVVDFVWISTKAYDLEGALPLIEGYPCTVIPLLNGIDHVPRLRALFGHNRVVPATIAVEAERTAPGHFVQRTPVRLGLAASAEPALKDIVTGLRTLGFDCRFVENEQTLLWSKLCFLGPFALTTSASGKNNGEIMADAGWRNKLHAAIAEAAAVANASGAEIDHTKLRAVFEGSPATMRASMAKDLAAGRRLELDAIAGPILRGSKQHGVPVPVTQDLESIVRERAGRGNSVGDSR